MKPIADVTNKTTEKGEEFREDKNKPVAKRE